MSDYRMLISSGLYPAFAVQMFLSPELHFANVVKEPTSPGIQINEPCRLHPWMNKYIQN